jgi:hypothetical protein
MSENVSLIILNNPVIFMNESYLKKNLLKGKFSKVESIPICQNEVIIKIIFKFNNSTLVDQFLTEYDNKPLSNKTDYKYSFSKTDKTEEEIKKEFEDYEKLKEFEFYYDYENEWKNNYTNSTQKSGLLYINEEIKKLGYEAIKYLIAKLGKNILQGKSILNISFPVFMFDKRTLHTAFAYEQKFAPLFLTKAALCNDKIERLKWVTTYMVSFLHMDVIQIKPFNPIIGETFQCRIGNTDIYVEQTVNHPLTLNIYCKERSGLFTVYGYCITDASTNINSLTLARLGKCFIKFKDNTIYRYRIPPILLKGLTMGDRLFNYIQNSIVQDLTNELTAYIEMNPDEPGFLASFIKSKKTFPDFFRGKIISSNDVDPNDKGGLHKVKKDAKVFSTIEGEWTSYINFDGEEYWNNETTKGFKIYSHNFVCPSDGRFRPDLINLIKGNQEQSQIEKENLEVRQRQDRKLRADYMSKKK